MRDKDLCDPSLRFRIEFGSTEFGTGRSCGETFEAHVRLLYFIVISWAVSMSLGSFLADQHVRLTLAICSSALVESLGEIWFILRQRFLAPELTFNACNIQRTRSKVWHGGGLGGRQLGEHDEGTRIVEAGFFSSAFLTASGRCMCCLWPWGDCSNCRGLLWR